MNSRSAWVTAAFFVRSPLSASARSISSGSIERLVVHPVNGEVPPVKAGRGNCRTMQTVEKQLVLEENWQVLAVVFPPFAQRLENSVSRACWPGSMSLGVFHSSHGLCYCSRLYGQANGEQIWDPESAEPRSHLPIYRMTQIGCHMCGPPHNTLYNRADSCREVSNLNNPMLHSRFSSGDVAIS